MKNCWFQFVPLPMKNINHLRLASFCCLGWTLNVADLLGVEPSAYKFGFEEAESFSMGSIDGQRGWSLDQGVVEILPAEGTDGSAGLALLGTELFGQASLIIPRPNPVDSNDGQSGQTPHLTFIDMWIRMPATESSSFEETLDIDSARVGLFLDSLDPSLAHWHVFHGDGSGGGSWINTGQTVDFTSTEAETSPWTRLTIEQDIDHQCWNLWVDGALLSQGLGFQYPPSTEMIEVFLLGHVTQPTYLDELSISAEKPLPNGPNESLPTGENISPTPPTNLEEGEVIPFDADADGLTDAWELANGLDPANPADALSDQDSDGLSAFDEFSLGTDPTNKDLIRRDVSAGASLFSRFAGTSARRARVPSP